MKWSLCDKSPWQKSKGTLSDSLFIDNNTAVYTAVLDIYIYNTADWIYSSRKVKKNQMYIYHPQ